MHLEHLGWQEPVNGQPDKTSGCLLLIGGGCPSRRDLFAGFGVGLAGQRVVDRKQDSAQEQDRGHRSDQDADRPDRRLCLLGRIGYESAPIQYQKGNREGDRNRHFLNSETSA
jgi:hypothetical protein